MKFPHLLKIWLPVLKFKGPSFSLRQWEAPSLYQSIPQLLSAGRRCLQLNQPCFVANKPPPVCPQSQVPPLGGCSYFDLLLSLLLLWMLECQSHSTWSIVIVMWEAIGLPSVKPLHGIMFLHCNCSRTLQRGLLKKTPLSSQLNSL